MQELRLVGVQENGGHLLLSGEGSETYSLPINEALRMAASHQSAQRSAPSRVPGDQATMSPRDIQARIRAGATAADVAAESGGDMAHILRYEGPVLAERNYIAEQAQRVEVAGPLPSNDGYRSVFGDTPARLVDMVEHRLRSFGVNQDDVRWDAWRGRDGVWEVTAQFDLPETPVDVGEAPPARWTFVPARKAIANANRWAQILSELEPLDGPLPARRLSAVADRPFDFETDAGKEAAQEPLIADHSAEPDELLETLRSRRGQRIGADEDGDDALALLLSRGSIPAAHPRTDEDAEDSGNDSSADHEAETSPVAEGPSRRFTSLTLAPSLPTDGSGLPQLHDGVSSSTHEIVIPASDVHRDYLRTVPEPERQEKASAEPEAAVVEPPDRKNVKPKRSSVPSWDEIVFGTKGD
ncbi:septation protein SepH [Arthrobacter roseus]|nr:septation protein SepH [Arthrobacter roseus]